MKSKTGAIELSIGTIVIVVLAMTMLIGGLVLISNIFDSTKYNVNEMNTKVKNEIGKLFTEDERVVLYTNNGKVAIKQGKEWGVGMAIKNLNKGAEDFKFSYTTTVIDPKAQKKCGISVREIESWIDQGETTGISIPSGETEFFVIRLYVPDSAPLCEGTVRFKIEIRVDGQVYDNVFFDLETLAK